MQDAILRRVWGNMIKERDLSFTFWGLLPYFDTFPFFIKMAVVGCFGVYSTRGLFAVLIGLLSFHTYAADCFERAGRYYRINPDLLRAIS